MSPSLVAAGYRHAEGVAREHARSFYFASRALDRRRRTAALALYAFCRRVDDLVDEGAASPAEMAHRLGAGRRTIAAVFRGRLGEAAAAGGPWLPQELAALEDTVRRCRVPEAPLQELITGVEMDLTPRRYANWDDLAVYCQRVAGTVGLMMAPVLGYRDPAALGPAAALGRAMQLTNILRDIGEDLDRGRLYLPLEALAAAGLSEDDLRRRCAGHRFQTLMRDAIVRTRALYAEALRGVHWLDGPRARLTVRLMAIVYRDILRVIERQEYDVFRRRAVVPGRRKLALALGAVRHPRYA